MTKEDFLNKRSEFTMKSLRRFVEKNKDMSDDAPILIERVEDRYFEGRELKDGNKSKGWDVLKVEGYHYYSNIQWNEKMEEEIERIKNGEEREYNMEDPSKMIFDDEFIEASLEQFYQGHCISTDKEIIYIYSHY
jgi:hypothetical protein